METELSVLEGPAAPSAPSTPDIHEQEQEKSLNLSKELKLLGRWVLTIVFTILIFVVAKIYLAKGNITKSQKANYSLIQTALILALGLNFFEAFKELISVVRRKIGVWARCDNQERQLMEEIDSLLIVWRLLRKSYVKPRIAFFCVAWLAFNLIAQMAVALVSLTYSVDDGTDYHDTFNLGGIVNASNLTCYQRPPLDCRTYVATGHALAHAYGEYGSNLECGDYAELAEVLNSTVDYSYYCRRIPHKREFAYRFNEYNFDDKQKSYPHFTNRIINISSGACFRYNVTGKVEVPDITGDGQGKELSFENNTFKGSIRIPDSALGLLSTTYIYQGIKAPEDNSPEAACGDRCIMMWASQNPVDGLNTLYQCPIHVSTVSNATQDAHHVPDGVARIAAASIALQGRWSWKGANQDYTQYQFYAYGYGIVPTGRSMIAPLKMSAKFAIQSLAMMVRRNPPVRIVGSVPYLGSRLVVFWDYFIALLSCIVGVHFALFAVTVLWVTKVAKDVVISKFVEGDLRNESQLSILRQETE